MTVSSETRASLSQHLVTCFYLRSKHLRVEHFDCVIITTVQVCFIIKDTSLSSRIYTQFIIRVSDSDGLEKIDH